MSATKPNPILEARGIAKRYGSIHALRGVDLSLYPGEVLALVGDNGAGKSTLLKILSGNTQPSEGTLHIAGLDHQLSKPSDATSAGIATVYQDLALALDLSVADNLYLGKEKLRGGVMGRGGWLDQKAMIGAAQEALQKVQIRIPDVTVECGSLSGGQRQAVAIARALEWCQTALLLDEPTAALGVEQQREVLNLIMRVRDSGIGVILVSHQLVHVLEVADRIAVLRQGAVVGVLSRSEASVERLLALITGLDGKVHDYLHQNEIVAAEAAQSGGGPR